MIKLFRRYFFVKYDELKLPKHTIEIARKGLERRKKSGNPHSTEMVNNGERCPICGNG